MVLGKRPNVVYLYSSPTSKYNFMSKLKRYTTHEALKSAPLLNKAAPLSPKKQLIDLEAFVKPLKAGLPVKKKANN